MDRTGFASGSSSEILAIDVAACIGVIYMDDILVVNNFVQQTINPLTPTIVTVPSTFQVGYTPTLSR